MSRRQADSQHAFESTAQNDRLQKVLAAAGLGSRRACELLIREARVEVDGRVVTELGTKVDPARQEIRVDGQPLARPRRVYFAVHKPAGVVSTNRDPAGRARVIDLVDYPGRLFTVGRLDMSSEGLIVVTNDGALANRLTHPRYGVEKTYHVEIAGQMSPSELAVLRKGVHLAEGLAHTVSAKVKQRYRGSTLLEIVLAEGRNREIRRMLARVGHKVLRLKRVALGPLRLAELPPGAVRSLSADEVRKLKQAARALAAAQPGSRAAAGDRRPKQSAAKSRRPGGPRAIADKKKQSPETRRRVLK